MSMKLLSKRWIIVTFCLALHLPPMMLQPEISELSSQPSVSSSTKLEKSSSHHQMSSNIDASSTDEGKSSSLNPCNLTYKNDRDFFTVNKNILDMETSFLADNRPCNLFISLPNQDKPAQPILVEGGEDKSTANKNLEAGKNIIVLSKKILEKRVLKLRITDDDDGTELEGKYNISGLIIFASPNPSGRYVAALDLACPSGILKGRISLTKEFHRCCEYHGHRSNSSKQINCCEECIEKSPDNIKDNINITINYEERYFDFEFVPNNTLSQSHSLEVSCNIVFGSKRYKFPIKFDVDEDLCLPANVGAYIGVSVMLFTLFILSIMVVFLRKKNKNLSEKITPNPPDLPDWAKELSYPRGHLKFDEDSKSKLGEGGFGVVIKARAQTFGSMSINIAANHAVAVKTLKEGSCKKDKDEFMREGELMAGLEYHHNIINLLAVSIDKPENHHRILLVLEFCSRGSLDKILQTKLEEIKDDPELVETVDFNMKLLVAWSYQIAMGMEYLANHFIIHGDLAARNILVDEDNTVKIADFGHARKTVYDNIPLEVEGRQPVYWMAPEAVRDGQVTMVSDIWSYGVILWEMFSLGEEPYPGRNTFSGLLDELEGGYRLPMPERCPTQIYSKVILATWNADPNERPPWPKMIEILRQMVDSKYLEKYTVIETRKRDNYAKIRKVVNKHKPQEKNSYVICESNRNIGVYI